MSRRESSAVTGCVVSVSLSAEKGVSKLPVEAVELRPDWGVAGDAHAAPGDRQVSLLAEETIERMKRMLASVAERDESDSCHKAGGSQEEITPDELGPGSFAENITTRGLDLPVLPLGTRVTFGDEVVTEVSRIGKECHTHCAIFEKIGHCPMPEEGIFVRVIQGGTVRPGDEVRIGESMDSDGQ